MKNTILLITALAITLLFSSCSKEKEAGIFFEKFRDMDNEDSLLFAANNISKKYPETKYGYACKAYIFIHNDELDSANEYITKALMKDKDFGYCYNLRGDIFKKKEDFRIAIEDYQHCLKLKYDTYSTNIDIGGCYAGLKNYDSAIIYLNAAITEDPFNGDGYYYRGLLKVNFKNYEEAVDDLDKSLNYNNNNWNAHNFKGIALGYLKRYTEALKCFNTAISLKPDEVNIYVNRAHLKAYMKDKDAREDYDIAIRMDGFNEYIYESRAEMYLMEKKYSDALKDLNKAFELGSKKPFTYYKRAIANAYLFKKKEAMDDINKAIELDPAYADAYIWRGALRYAFNEKSKACDDLREAVRLGSKEAEEELKKYCK
ncbi:MAG: tetratricopeptide repeat protein [Ignavibacteriae bacterium]|nr:MAG: tetratricopeptide repeat protein [Ignavibacteriota bacterium]